MASRASCSKSRFGGDTGRNLVDMLDGCQHRGPDSTGFDDAPGEIRNAVSQAAESKGCAWLARTRPDGAVPWLQLLDPGEAPDRDAAAAI